ncbi:hypothetical protein DSECCO2_294430 [anaerobic digester metagenome]
MVETSDKSWKILKLVLKTVILLVFLYVTLINPQRIELRILMAAVMFAVIIFPLKSWH